MTENFLSQAIDRGVIVGPSVAGFRDEATETRLLQLTARVRAAARHRSLLEAWRELFHLSSVLAGETTVQSINARCEA